MVLPHFVINGPSRVCKDLALLDLFFHQKGISHQEDMLGYVDSVLLQDVISKEKEIIISPPTEKPYDKLCDKITACMTVSTRKRIMQLLEQETLGNSTLSQFLKQLQNLVEGTVDKSILKHIFLQRIPAQYKLTIAVLDKSTPVEQMVSIVDHIAALLSTQM